MRIWSIHPKYLDAKGLVALWRETLLAKHVLEGKTKGYKNHPQLNRFKAHVEPLHAINHYLSIVHEEATKRNYRFDGQKIDEYHPAIIKVSSGQVDYEIRHLKNKLMDRDPVKLEEINRISLYDCHPLFEVVEGGVEDWEIL
jgi:hypothetical protein